jgi:hypothetical protein
MYKAQFNHYKDAELQPLVEHIQKDYYDVLDGLCDAARKQAMKLRNLETQQATFQYINLCAKLCDDIQKYIQIRKDIFIPYVMKLAEKKDGGHDCRSCQGGCAMQHDIHLTELRETHSNIKGILHRLQMAALPLYSQTIYPDAYRVLRNQMALLENSLTELYFVEEAYLIPKVTEAQKNINVN